MRDATRLPRKPAGARSVEAPHPWVWIYVDGAWRAGAIHCWFVVRDQWSAWLQYPDPNPDVPWAVWGHFVHDGRSIRRRHHPAAVAHVEGAAGHEAAGRLRALGYAVDQGRDVIRLG
jgi:hypothetical protein